MTPPLFVQSRSGRLRVEFAWVVDRYQHRVLDSLGNGLISVDGNAEEAWPPSPPIQQLSLERVDGQEVILGLGAAGTAHWSISVVPTETESGDAIHFELACRCRQSPERLESTYRPLANGLRINTALASAVEDAGDGRLCIRPDVHSAGGTTQWSYWVS